VLAASIFPSTFSSLSALTGTETQIEWARRIQARVAGEFDRVRRVFEVVGEKQHGPAKAETAAIVAIVEEMRSNVLANDQAGYYIREWQDLKNQVREMVLKDPRFEAIRANRELRKVRGA
jgi:hypothetical protein